MHCTWFVQKNNTCQDICTFPLLAHFTLPISQCIGTLKVSDSFVQLLCCTLGVMSERALSRTSWAVDSFSVWGGWGSALPWMAGTVSTLKRGCQRVSLSSGTEMGGTSEERKVCREAATGQPGAQMAIIRDWKTWLYSVIFFLCSSPYFFFYCLIDPCFDPKTHQILHAGQNY